MTSSATGTVPSTQATKKSKHDRQILAVKKRIDKTSEVLRSLNDKLKTLEQFNKPESKASNDSQ